ncbi:ABC transporter ATP-binding protein [Desulfococcus multivorans]|uniref:ABC transporter related protein n=1 Tax=Desulfococcus multivorans DSM 2059 TaxID=1121405 RepID=S7TWA5_DESML|nr:ABC transporter ATP-binding protein [Desulfococcus multivorans]AOY58119.1 putative ABC transporter, transmembrane region [Desulfococcus multivorans]AQV00476.1 ABC transporter ATP-binding protein [Desulfococcus multivorans]EPR41311.1 ABC transporter related protein [Desulfococcus multivorans DSM 2059]SJZ73153.1 ATP-binding cassette, subfamily C [Desulfococcus multivorans DSM 2059]
MRLPITFFRRYPGESLLTLLALLLAGVAEGFGMTMLLPLLGIAIGGPADAIEASPGQKPALEQTIIRLFELIGLSPTIGLLLAVFVLCIMMKAALLLIANKRVGYMVSRVATDLRLDLIRALFTTRWEYYVHQPIGRFTNAFATEARRSADAYLYGIRIMAQALQAAVYTVVALMVARQETLTTLLAGFVILFALRHLVKKAKTAGNRQTQLLKSLLSQLTDTLQSIKPLKAMARENLADAVLQTRTRRLNKALRKQVFSEEALKALQEPLITLFLGFGLYAALVWWEMPMATVIVMIFMLIKILKALQKAQKEYQSMVIAESAYWSLWSKIEEARREKEHHTGSLTPVLEEGIRIENVSFGYGDRFVLKDLSMSFPMGSFSAIIGPSGAGKTTVVDLITGLLTPREGTIWIDDMPLTAADIKAWRRMIGYVPQETLLLHDTVMVNVTLGDPAFDEKDAQRALSEAGAWGFVAEMPAGIHTVVGERGARLSGGQRQRITIARALVHRPRLMILDEATSALDPASEAEICQTLRQLKGRLTILAISHQTALLEAADRAYRLHMGMAELLATPDEKKTLRYPQNHRQGGPASEKMR